MKVLIGGVPYGRDNVGDEAIIATIVQIVRSATSKAEITVSTDEPEYLAKKLDVRTVPLLGFEDPPYDPQQLEEEMEKADVYIWGGATGLSDYPETALKIADTALRHNAKLVLHTVGMNSKLNPAFFTLQESYKKKILRLIKFITLGYIDLIRKIEGRKEEEAFAHIRSTLNQASLIIVRDEESKQQLHKCGVKKDIQATTDPAILLPLADEKRIQEIWQNNDIWEDDIPIVGVCVSAQRAVKQTNAIVSVLDYLIEEKGVHILFIPMNDKTDYFLMEDIKADMKHGDQTRNLKGRYDPEEIAAVAAKVSLILSSRLHLIILAAISEVPVAGLSRGSKIDKYLRYFGEVTAGSVESFNPDKLKKILLNLLENKNDFSEKAKPVIVNIKEKAQENIELLKTILN